MDDKTAREKLGALFKAWDGAMQTDYLTGDELTGADCLAMGSLNFLLGFKMPVINQKPVPVPVSRKPMKLALQWVITGHDL